MPSRDPSPCAQSRSYQGHAAREQILLRRPKRHCLDAGNGTAKEAATHSYPPPPWPTVEKRGCRLTKKEPGIPQRNARLNRQDMMENPSSRPRLKPGPRLLQIECGLCQLLHRYRAVYSTADADFRGAFLAGTLTPVRCHCGSWFLVETDAERSSRS